MSDFGTGFATGFANSLAEGIKRNDQRAYEEKQDMMKLSYNYMMKQDDKRAEREAESQKNIRKAKALAKSMGAPEGAWPEIYEAVDSGMSDKQIDAMFSSGEWGARAGANSEVSGSKSNLKSKLFGNAADDQSTAPAPNQQVNPVQAQTEQATGVGPTGNAGIQQAPQARTEQPTGKKLDKFSGLLSNASGKFKEVLTGPKNDPAQVRQEAAKRFAGATGRTPDQIGQPYQPNIPQATHTFNRTASNMPDLDVDSKGKAIAAVQRTKMMLEQNPTPANQRAHKLATDTLAAWNENEINLENQKALASNKYAPGGIKVAMFDTSGSYLGPKNLVNLTDNGDGTATDPQSGQVVRIQPITEATQKQQQDITQRVAKEYRPVQVKQQNAVSLLKDYNDVKIILKDNPDALNRYTTGAAQAINTFLNEANAGVNLVDLTVNRDKKIGEVDPSLMQNNIVAAEAALNSGQLDPVRKAAAAGALIEAKRSLMAYRIGMAMGQEGRSLAEAERELFSDIALKGKNDGTLDRNFANIFFNIADTVDREGKALINDDVELKEFEAQNGFPAISAINPNFLESMKNSSDPTVRDTFALLAQARVGRSGADVGAAARQNAGAQEAPQQTQRDGPVVNSPQEAMKLKPGTVFYTPDGKRKVRP